MKGEIGRFFGIISSSSPRRSGTGIRACGLHPEGFWEKRGLLSRDRRCRESPAPPQERLSFQGRRGSRTARHRKPLKRGKSPGRRSLRRLSPPPKEIFQAAASEVPCTTGRTRILFSSGCKSAIVMRLSRSSSYFCFSSQSSASLWSSLLNCSGAVTCCW